MDPALPQVNVVEEYSQGELLLQTAQAALTVIKEYQVRGRGNNMTHSLVHTPPLAYCQLRMTSAGCCSFCH